MSAGPWTLTNEGITLISNGTLRAGVDSFKIALFKSTSNIGAASTTFAGITNECDTGGYSAGGQAVTIGLSGTTTVTWSLSDTTWTVSSTTLVARFAVIYEVGGNVLAYALLDSTPADVSQVVGQDFIVLGTNNLMTIANT